METLSEGTVPSLPIATLQPGVDWFWQHGVCRRARGGVKQVFIGGALMGQFDVADRDQGPGPRNVLLVNAGERWRRSRRCTSGIWREPSGSERNGDGASPATNCCPARASTRSSTEPAHEFTPRRGSRQQRAAAHSPSRPPPRHAIPRPSRARRSRDSSAPCTMERSGLSARTCGQLREER